MIYTKKFPRPFEDCEYSGLYWLKAKPGEGTIVQATYFPGGKITYSIYGSEELYETTEGKFYWAGPIEQPRTVREAVEDLIVEFQDGIQEFGLEEYYELLLSDPDCRESMATLRDWLDEKLPGPDAISENQG